MQGKEKIIYFKMNFIFFFIQKYPKRSVFDLKFDLNKLFSPRTGLVTTWWPASGVSAVRASVVSSVRRTSTSVRRTPAFMEEHVKMASTLTAASVWLVMKAETVKVKILNSF